MTARPRENRKKALARARKAADERAAAIAAAGRRAAERDEAA